MSRSRKAPRKKLRSKDRLDRRHAIDLAIRFTLALTFVLSASIYFRNGLQILHGIDVAHPDGKAIAFGFSVFTIGFYMLMIGCLYVLRLSPKNKFAGAGPCAAAILGSFLLSALLLVDPPTHLPLIVQIAASLLVLIGNIFSVVVLLRLGRSFSLLPESRKLVTTGPYKVVRHPLYLAEAIGALGALIHFLSPWALLLIGAQLGLQLIRIRYEERVLHETFPEYAKYARRTARLIPGVY